MKLFRAMNRENSIAIKKTFILRFSVLEEERLPLTELATGPNYRRASLRQRSRLRWEGRWPWSAVWRPSRRRATKRCWTWARPSRGRARAPSADEARPKTCPGWTGRKGPTPFEAKTRCQPSSSNSERRWLWKRIIYSTWEMWSGGEMNSPSLTQPLSIIGSIL